MENGLLGESSQGIEQLKDCLEFLALMILDAYPSVASVESLLNRLDSGCILEGSKLLDSM